jgi:CBS domain containing-hemolysin-like protein
VIEATRETGHSRFPVIGDSVDDIRGVIHVKQAVAIPELDRTTTRVREVMTAPVLVPPSIALDPLLDRLQQRGLQLAVVVDEYGGTAGIVTFVDLVEELVGDVVDEHDSAAPGIWRQPDGSWLVSGLLRPDEIRAAASLELPAGRAAYETVAGLICAAAPPDTRGWRPSRAARRDAHRGPARRPPYRPGARRPPPRQR